MTKRILFTLLLILIFIPGWVSGADYMTPVTDDGVSLTLDDIVMNSGGIVTGSFPNYTFNGGLVVSEKDTLTIAAGTTVTFTDSTGWDWINVIGVLNVEGTEANPVTFTSSGKTPGDWYAIGFDPDSESQSSLTYLIIEYAVRGIDDYYSAGFVLENGIIRNCQNTGIFIDGTSSTIQNSTIQNIDDGSSETIYGIGIVVRFGGTPTIEGNTIQNISKSAIYVDGSSPTITGNTIQNIDDGSTDSFYGRGISVWNGASPTINNNTLKNISKAAIIADNSTPTITNNSIDKGDTSADNSPWGIYLQNNCNVSIQGNTIENMEIPIKFVTGSTGSVDANEIIDNVYGVEFYNSDGFTVSNNFLGSHHVAYGDFDYSGTGLYFEDSTGDVSGNEIRATAWGMTIKGTSSITAVNNNLHDNNKAIYIQDASADIDLGNLEDTDASNDGGNTFDTNLWHVYTEAVTGVKAENNNWGGSLSLTERKLYGDIDIFPANPPFPASPELTRVDASDDAIAPSSGNGDGIINASESVELYLTLSNTDVSTDITGGIYGILSTDNPNIVLEETEQLFGDLPAAGTVINTSPFIIKPLNSIGNGETVNLTLTMASSWVIEFTVTVINEGDQTAPVLSESHVPSYVTNGQTIPLVVKAVDGDPDMSVTAVITDGSGTELATVTLVDDGDHGDYLSGDYFYGGSWTVPSSDEFYIVTFNATDTNENTANLSYPKILSDIEGSQVLKITNISNLNGQVTVSYCAHSELGNTTTTNWQFSQDGSSWSSINAAQISNNAPKPSGCSHIIWNSLAGDNNLAGQLGADETTFQFKMDLVTNTLSKLDEVGVADSDFIRGVTIQGSTMWSCDSETGNVFAHRLDSTLSIYKTIQYPGTSCQDIVWDGNYLWTADDEASQGEFHKHNLDDTLSIQASYLSPEDTPAGLTWKDNTLWSSDWSNSTIYQHNMDGTLSVADSPSANTDDSAPIPALAFVNGTLWVADSGYVDNLYQLDSDKSTISNQFSTSAWLGGLSWDGRSLWAANGSPTPNVIRQYATPSNPSDTLSFGFVLTCSSSTLTSDADNDGICEADDAFPDDATESLDTDGDGTGDNADPDDDNDGVNDDDDAFPKDSAESADNDGDGTGDNADTDDDNDGVADTDDAFPKDATETLDTDGDGIGNRADADDDGDGIADIYDAFPLNASESLDNDSDGIGDNADPDDDNDGVNDDVDTFPRDAAETSDNDGDGTGDNADTDDDNDGVNDSQDAFPFDATETSDNDGDGTGDNADTDDDNDGVSDSQDAFPFDASESTDADGDGTGDNADLDDDNDGVYDTDDAFPFDATETLDTDSDGVGDNADAFPEDPAESLDSDNDGIGDNADAFPLDANESVDTDGDGVGDNADAFPEDSAETLDSDGDGIGNNADNDDDGDGTIDSVSLITSIDSPNTTESGGQAVLAIKLGAQPSDNVIVDIASSDTTEGTVSRSSLTFTTDNWSNAQSITIAGVNDDLTDGDQTYQITLSINSSTLDSTGYSAITPDPVSMVNSDDETAGVYVDLLEDKTSERGEVIAVDVCLKSEPDGLVVFDIASSDETEGTVSPSKLEFTPQNWMTQQSVMVVGQDDQMMDGDQAYNLILSVDTSLTVDGTGFSSLGDVQVAITNVDDETPGLKISGVSGQTTESGGQASFTVQLNSLPSGAVTLDIQSLNKLEGTVDPKVLTFTENNWHSERVVTVTGQDDALNDGNREYGVQINVNAQGTTDTSGYADIRSEIVKMTNQDNEQAGLTLSAVNGFVSESGGQGEFTVKLCSKPNGDVILDVTSNDVSEGTISPAQLTFTVSNWNISQKVTISGVDDSVLDGDQAFKVTLSPDSRTTSDTTGFASLDTRNVLVKNIDDDTAGVSIGKINGNTSEHGDSAVFKVRLNSLPSDTVTIDINSLNSSEGTVSPTSLVFTPSDWNAEKIVTVTGVNDSEMDGNQKFLIQVGPIVSSDTDYTGLANQYVQITNIDKASTPTIPVLNSPADGQANVSLPLVVSYEKSVDPNDEAVSYRLYICDSLDFSSCGPPESVAGSTVSAMRLFRLAGYSGWLGLVIVLCGFAITYRSRKRVFRALLSSFLIVTLFSCGGGGDTSSGETGGNDGGDPTPVSTVINVTTEASIQPRTTYYWKVVAKDGDGNQSESKVFTFTSD